MTISVTAQKNNTLNGITLVRHQGVEPWTFGLRVEQTEHKIKNE